MRKILFLAVVAHLCMLSGFAQFKPSVAGIKTVPVVLAGTYTSQQYLLTGHHII